MDIISVTINLCDSTSIRFGGRGGFHMNIHFNINQFNYRDRCLEHLHISGAKKIKSGLIFSLESASVSD